MSHNDRVATADASRGATAEHAEVGPPRLASTMNAAHEPNAANATDPIVTRSASDETRTVGPATPSIPASERRAPERAVSGERGSVPPLPATARPVPSVMSAPIRQPALATLATSARSAPRVQDSTVKIKQPTPAGREHVHSTPDIVTDERAQLLTEYQRVGRALIELRDLSGYEASQELWQEFRALDIQQALATKQSRAEAAATLADMRARIARQKGVHVSDACLNNPLASGCR